jgi:hypothetical protein
MSMTKRIWFDRHPEDDPIRERLRAEASDDLQPFVHRIAMKRRNSAGRPYWDAFWPVSLNQAARELEIDVVRINGGMFTRQAEERQAIEARAGIVWQSFRARLSA